ISCSARKFCSNLSLDEFACRGAAPAMTASPKIPAPISAKKEELARVIMVADPGPCSIRGYQVGSGPSRDVPEALLSECCRRGGQSAPGRAPLHKIQMRARRTPTVSRGGDILRERHHVSRLSWRALLSADVPEKGFRLRLRADQIVAMAAIGGVPRNAIAVVLFLKGRQLNFGDLRDLDAQAAHDSIPLRHASPTFSTRPRFRSPPRAVQSAHNQLRCLSSIAGGFGESEAAKSGPLPLSLHTG